jgi:hypothetical protein
VTTKFNKEKNMADTNLALDGPLNGAFINKEQADANGYVPGEWSTGEQVWFHSTSPLTEDDAFPENPCADMVHGTPPVVAS